jgi:aryl-alcohol dehydrogenase-like predicted oxidoreductase
MDYRRLGASGLLVPALSFGAGTFSGRGELFGAWGDTGARQARRLVDIAVEAGVTMFDTADVYSSGASEEVLGEAIRGGGIDCCCPPRRPCPPVPDRTRQVRAARG